jgi:pimeloyl-ACP methyl ester carboxylesterase
MKCELADIEIFYETRGAGRPIVMLPGRPSDHRIMERFMEPLFAQRDGWLRIYPDLPGTGLTPAPDRLSTQDHLIETMLAFIDALLPGQRFVLAGYSAGGYLAQGVAASRAALIDGLLLCAPQMKGDESQAHLPEKTTLVKNPDLLARLAPDIAGMVEYAAVVQNSTVIDALNEVLTGTEPDSAFMERLDRSGPAAFELDPQPPVADFPTLILTARQDNICGYRDACDLLDRYPRATFAALDRAGHFVGFEQAGLCQALMGEWLDRVEEYINR